MLLEESFVADAPEVIEKMTQKFIDSNPGADIEMKSGEGVAQIVFNSLDFSELIGIMLVNSAEAAGTKRKKLKIGLSLSQAGGKIILEYSDNSKAVPAKLRDTIFESGVSTKGPGRGFGLNFAAMAVKKYGGKIMLGPENGSGPKFIVELNPY